MRTGWSAPRVEVRGKNGTTTDSQSRPQVRGGHRPGRDLVRDGLRRVRPSLLQLAVIDLPGRGPGAVWVAALASIAAGSASLSLLRVVDTRPARLCLAEGVPMGQQRRPFSPEFKADAVARSSRPNWWPGATARRSPIRSLSGARLQRSPSA